MTAPRLLVLSNGHGEDLIALRVLESLHPLRPELQVSVLPLVGLGGAFAAAETAGWLRRVGRRQPLPSGGFSNQSVVGLLRDLAAGLPLLTAEQLALVRRWGRSGDPVLAIGDLLPLLLAWAGGGPFGFVGTPKSDFTWCSTPPAGWGSSAVADAYHRCKGSEWDPWEWALMGSRRCRLLALRDRLTARGLQRRGLPALAPGNPMMDGLEPSPPPEPLLGRRRLLLLPGSRLPEALTNLKRLLAALPACLPAGAAPWTLLLATGSRPGIQELGPVLEASRFQPCSPLPSLQASAAWRRGDLELQLGPGLFATWASWAELGLATAGTATEQLVGLGVPALSLPGPGPQFQAGFARRQSRLLGGAVEPCHGPAELQRRLLELLADPRERQRLGRRGRLRMGPPGGSARLAALISARLLGDMAPRGAVGQG